jgi:anti-anti-sigma factor
LTSADKVEGVFSSEDNWLIGRLPRSEAVLTTSDLDPAAHRLRLSLSGELDVATVRQMFVNVVDAMPWPGDAVSLDMSDVGFIDSSGVSMLLNVRNYLDGMGCRLSLANPSQPLMRLLELLELTELFSIESD